MSPSSSSDAIGSQTADTAVPESTVLESRAFESTVFESTVTLPANLHARPAGKLAQAAAGFASTITIQHGVKSVDAARVLAVMSLGATAGTSVTLRAEGPDAEQAVHALEEILQQAE